MLNWILWSKIVESVQEHRVLFAIAKRPVSLRVGKARAHHKSYGVDAI